MRPTVALLAVFTAIAPAAFGQAAPPEMKDVLSGSATPLTVKLKEMDGTWRRMTLTGTMDASGMSSLLTSFFGGGGGALYTKGQTVTMGGQTYIVAYRVKTKPIDFTSLMSGKPDMNTLSALLPAKLSEDSVLSLSLVNLHTAGSIQDIRAFDMPTEIAESGSNGGGLMGALLPLIMGASGGMGGGMNPFGASATPDSANETAAIEAPSRDAAAAIPMDTAPAVAAPPPAKPAKKATSKSAASRTAKKKPKAKKH